MPWLKPGIFIGALVPLASIVWRASRGQLDANPIAQIINELGLAAIIFLVASLACTPARWLFGWAWPVRVRRELGLFAFFYAVLHFLTYLVDQSVDLEIILEDIALRPFITVGFLALVLMVPLAWTSSSEWVRRLGYRRWQKLHYLAYVAGVLAVIHFIWRVKIDLSQPLIYAGVLAALLLVRVVFWLRGRSRSGRAQ
jgi:sulfoxide reductase heme-binding subunit YedZ